MPPQVNMREFQGALIDERYYLDQYLAEGGFGAVYRAVQQAYGQPLREVAIKIAKRPMDDAEASSAFSDALLMAKVVDSASDPLIRQHFVTIHDAGRCPQGGALAGHPYLVMEYIRGGSLKNYLRHGPLTLTRALEYFDQILVAMDYMHGGLERPVAHRDLKPDNILVARGEDGKTADRVIVTDFGLAIEVDSILGWVDSGGDLAYLAPESFSLDISSPQSDVYMLGLVFYEMLTGHNPFSQVGTHLRGDEDANRAELRRIHYHARQVERFPALADHIELRQHPRLVEVLRAMLAIDTHTRGFRTACDLRPAWKRALEPVIVPPDPDGGQPLHLSAWQNAARLVAEAEGCFAVADPVRGDALLAQAMTLNRDPRRVPDKNLVGKAYLLAVQRLLQQGQREEARQMAHEGYNRRKCRSTCQALAAYYQAQRSPLAASFMREAETCPDRE